MKDDFFAGLFEQARKTANDLLDKGESLLREVENDLVTEEPSQELEDLRMDVDRLEAQNEDLKDQVHDLESIIQVLLDGEASKDITVTWKRFYNLRDYTLDYVYSDNGTDLVIELRQTK